MTKSLFAIAVLLTSLSAVAQISVRIQISSLPSYNPSGSDIYIAGSFNDWNPRDKDYKLSRDNNNRYYINLNLRKGFYEYKITRGAWDKVECKSDGNGIENRTFRLSSDTVISLDIEGWIDHFPPQPKVSSASKNVHIIDTTFAIPQLERTRRVWIYLPEGYEQSESRFPVLYMQDGQNVFDNATSFGGEWGVDEFLDSTFLNKAIVVAIDHGGNKRLTEYNPYDNASFGKGEGEEYLDFLVHSLKPFIDTHYRTFKDMAHTYIAGSSMGGLISMYAVVKYPDVFGGAGVFSPSFWITGKSIFNDIHAAASKMHSKIYLYCGKNEGNRMVKDIEKVYADIRKVSAYEVKLVLNENGQHNETTWRKEFPDFYQWLMK